MTQSEKIIKEIKQQLSNMTDKEREAFFVEMGFVFDKKACVRAKRAKKQIEERSEAKGFSVAKQTALGSPIRTVRVRNTLVTLENKNKRIAAHRAAAHTPRHYSSTLTTKKPK